MTTAAPGTLLEDIQSKLDSKQKICEDIEEKMKETEEE